LKGIALSFGGHIARGEAMITAAGIEGGVVYALSALLREAILTQGQATLHIALRPDLDRNDLAARLSAPKAKQSFSNWLRKAAHLSPVGIGLLQEAAIVSGVPLSSLAAAELAEWINAVPVQFNGVAPIARAISTAGGIAFDQLDDGFMIRRLPGVFAAGEMLDWEAPTGGYLLQASFATGAAAGRGVLRWLNETGPSK
jgi:predicted flavoprotein YhiN